MVCFMTNNKVCTDASKDNEMRNQILRLEACDRRYLPLLTLGNSQDGKCTSKSTLIMEGVLPSLLRDNITNYRPLKGTDKF